MALSSLSSPLFDNTRLDKELRAGIYSSLKTIVDKRVLPSLSPLFDNTRLDKELRAMLKERFGLFLTKDDDNLDPAPVIDRDDTFGGIHEPGGAPAFSDDEEEVEKKEEIMEIGSGQKSDTNTTATTN